MNRIEFMARLESLLADISSIERKEALQYYEDYFADAGAEHEQDVIREFGSPEKVASMIKADLKSTSDDAGAFTELGYEDERFVSKEIPARREDIEKEQKEAERQSGRNASAQKETASGGASREEGAYRAKEEANQTGNQTPPKTSTGMKLLLIALIVLIGFPVVIPAAAVALMLILGLVIGAFAFFAGLVIGAAAVALAGAAMVVIGIPILVTALPAGLLIIGIGLLIFVIGSIGTVAATKLCIVMYPAMCRIMVNICRWPFHRRKAVA